MTCKGVVFDFNGTLFWDTVFHNQAWDIFLDQHNLKISDKDKFLNIHGKTNREIFNRLFEGRLSDAEIYKYARQKELLYQQICLNHNLNLAPGAVSFIEKLIEKKIRYTIATASGEENVDFYFRHLKLGRWFDREKVVYNDGKIKGKPDPELFIKASGFLDLPASDLMIFEDSFVGIKAAENANAAKIYIVNSNDDDYSEYPHEVIRNFNEADLAYFG
ncbi:MAG: HAD family phosphatase [Cyclobacteriaceae bacterium]|nr:HAD family phosphatase [Cyclobacteriaceae bacterium]